MSDENGASQTITRNSPAPASSSGDNCFVRLIIEMATFLLTIMLCPVLVLVFPCMISLVAPRLYFEVRYFRYQDEELAQLFREKGYSVDSRVVKKWVTQTRTSDGDPLNTYHVILVYHADDGNQYSKRLIVSQEKYTQNRLEITVLRGYPRSAIVERYRKASRHELFGAAAFAIIWSFGWTAGLFYGFLYGVILSAFLEKGLAFAVASLAIIVCWTIGYFVARCERKSTVQHILNGAELVHGNRATNAQAQAQTKDSHYSILLSKETMTNRVFDILKTLVSDLVKLVFGVVAIAIVLAYMLLFGMYLYIMQLVIINRLGLFRLFDKQYAVLGQRIQGQIVERERPYWAVVRYSPFVGSTAVYDKPFKTVVRYGGVCCCKTENGDNRRFVRIPFPESDTIDLFILPNNPRSARLAVEIENRAAIYRIPTPGLIVFEAIFVTICTLLQTALSVFMLWSPLFPTQTLLLVTTCHVLVALLSSCVVAIIVLKRRKYVILNDAREVERRETDISNNTDEGVDIELASGYEMRTRETAELLREDEIRQL